MANLVQALRNRPAPDEARSTLTLQDYIALTLGGSAGGITTTLGGKPVEPPPNDFAGYVEAIYKRNGIVFACIAARSRLFSEARFKYRRIRDGRPGELFGNPSLAILERPWVNGTTGELLTRMEQDASIAGNFYAAKREGDGRPVLRRMRPDWVSIVLSGSDPDALDAEVEGYIYHPKGPLSKSKQVNLLPDEVVHYSPIPDPIASYRGMSWMTSVLREIQADGDATDHKGAFFRNGATPNLFIKFDPQVSIDNFKRWKEEFKDEHQGSANAYKTLMLGGGADVSVIGSNFEQMSFKMTQGAGETRIAAAAQIPPVLVGLSEGLAASTYSNAQQARRLFADHFARPHWRMAAASLAHLINVPDDAELWYDDRDIPFLQEDQSDAATIEQTKANTIKSLIDAGYEPKSVVAAVTNQDMSLLTHSGLYSVQLQPPGTTLTPAKPSAPAPPA